MVIGHGPLGVVEEVGSAVVSIQQGDSVVRPSGRLGIAEVFLLAWQLEARAP
jgi:hypothetical protein